MNCLTNPFSQKNAIELFTFHIGLVPKLLGFFQWNYSRELVLLRVLFFLGGGGGAGGEMVTGN